MYKSFEEMPVWQEAFQLANCIYDLIEKFPKTEMYALSDQLRRASVSISSNIAESYGRYHILDTINFYYHSRGSLCETKSHLLFALERKYISNEEYKVLSETIEKTYNDINSIIKSLRKNYIIK
jgi:four helix bundle protein